MAEPRLIEIALGDAPERRLDKALAAALPEAAALSRSRLAALIAAGAVAGPDGAAARDPAARPVPGGRYRLALPEATPATDAPEAIALEIVHEDADIVVVDKPAGMVVHPAAGAETGTLVNALLHHCGDGLAGIGGTRRPGIVHRIDKDTSGLVVAAKTDRAHAGLAAQFAAHSVERAYTAVCWGVPDAGDPRLAGCAGVSREPGGTLRIEAAIGRHPTDRKRMAVVAGGRRAVTRVMVREVFALPAPAGATPIAARVECRLETGRTHQIRVHMAHVGHPLVGDRTYGRRRTLPGGAPAELAAAMAGLPGQALHAARLGFRHPVSDAWLEFASDPPDAMATLITVLRRAAAGETKRGCEDEK